MNIYDGKLIVSPNQSEPEKPPIEYIHVEDGIFETGEWFTSPDYSGYALGYSLETFLGPIEAKYSWSPETKRGKWFFNLGFWF